MSSARPRGARPVIVDGALKWVVPSDVDVAPLSPAQQQQRQPSAAPLTAGGPRTLSGAVPPSAPVRVALWVVARARAHPFGFLVLALYLVLLVYVLPVHLGATPQIQAGLLTATICIGGTIYMCTCGIRKGRGNAPGELSAYSIFNPGGQRMAGTTTADQFDGEIRGGAQALQQRQQEENQRGAGWRLAGTGNVLGGARRPNNVGGQQQQGHQEDEEEEEEDDDA
jgi:hypothetical protein